MTAHFAAAQNCPPPEGPGLHSYSAAAEPPEALSPELWVTRPEPEPEAEI
jgi:hypothetical protein